jgi:NAD(P)-dependent dehydrogenase (short-subunit alcohol dehydrogenase family)
MTTIADPRYAGALRLDGKRALITGATKGIGADIARAFASAGAKLVLSGRDKEELGAARSNLAGEYGTEIHTTAVDLAQPDGPAELASRAGDAFGGLDVLVNNAGISHPQSVVDTDPALFDATIAVNLRAPALLASAVGAAMVAAGTGGSIITVASAAALAPLPDHYAYCVSKAGLVMATKVLARELGPYGIRASSVCPTVVLTEMGSGCGVRRPRMPRA